MLVKNMLHQAVIRGHTARFTLASDMLHDLAAQESSTQLTRRLRRYTTPGVLCVDEVGICPNDSRFADLLFDVIHLGGERHLLGSGVSAALQKNEHW